ncbi:MAG TPA: CRISPR-associated endonuclease Cas2 [Syntrophobacteraceae bacterium]|nr:CRISPR-associated endonuclease Cas2 [Syntrophobacteraceae bacterium]
MYVMVSYDIVKDRTRTRVMKLLKNYGHRVQLSVFECDLDEARYAEMMSSVAELIDPDADMVRSYRLCRGSLERVVISGWGELRVDEGFEII